MPIKKFILLFFAAVWYVAADAQNAPIHFTSLSSKDGLLSNVVNAIIKDSLGLMWFATDDGLTKFDGANFTVYRNKAGDTNSLRSNCVLSLFEDKRGNLWIGTSGGGLSLYNRRKDNFTNFPAANHFGGFSTNAVIRSVCSDYSGKIWIAQFDGLYVLDPDTKSIKEMKLDTDTGRNRVKQTLSTVFEDSQHRIWVGTDNGLYLYKRELNQFVRFTHNDTGAKGLSSPIVRAIAEDPFGNIWIGTANGLNRLLPGLSGFENYNITGHAIRLSSNEINCIAADKEGLLWIGTHEGLNKFNPQTNKLEVFVPEPDNIHSLTSKNIRCAYIDKQGIYWFGTFRGGINKYDKNGNLFNLKLSNAFQENSNKASIVSAFAGSSRGTVFIGTDDEGLFEFNPATENMRHIPFPQKTNAPAIISLQRTSDNQLYIGTYAQGLFILDPATGHMENLQKGPHPGNLSSNDIFCLKEDNKGALWIGTNGNGVNVLLNKKVIAKFTPHPKAPDELPLPVNGYIRAFAEDRDGAMWIGSHGAGLAMYQPATRSFTVFAPNNSNLPSDKIESLLYDSHGQLWIGTFGGGLSMYNKATNRFTNFSEQDGLQNTTIYQIVEDLQGRIWLSTNSGICSFDPATKSFRSFNSQHGVQNNNFVHGSGICLADGQVFFGGLQGFNYFEPAKLTINHNAPNVLLTELKISNKPVIAGNADAPIKEHISVAQEIRLDYKQNFALGFVALNYTNPKQNQYAYKLEGFDKDWNYTGAVNTASYTNLDPGHYTFRVKASNNDGIWSTRETRIKIYVKPPFWATVYAYTFYLLAIAGLLLYSRYRGITRLRKKFALEQERQEAKRVQELDRLKIKFLTNLSHDLRTPISLIMGPVDQLISAGNTTGQPDKLQMIRRNARRLLNLVNQLLDFRKMEEHELQLQLLKGEFVSFIKEVCESFRDLSERKNIQFTFKSDISELHTEFDRDKMERILFNLLSNAFKFTLAGGSVSVVVSAAEKQDDPHITWIVLKVTDTGIGIPAAEQERIFERFVQNNTAAHVLNQGTGIGLSITKEFVNLQGGTIAVESEPEKGTVFTIQIPFIPLSDEPEAIPEIQDIPLPSIPLIPEIPVQTILLVEDNEDFRFYLKDNLRNNYKVLEAANGIEGWQRALANHPQLIVSDISMPEMDGITLVKKLKADKRTSHIPVILLTAMTGEEQQIKGLVTGANDYISKPFNFEVLNARIKSLLDLKSTMQSTYSRQIKVVTPEVQIESADEKLLHEIVSYLEKNITNPQLSVEALSKEAGMSRTTLYSKLLQLTGESPVEYIRSFRLQKAAVLMEKSDLTIAEIAYQVGFTTPNYFSRSFKSKFNMLPSEYIALKKSMK